jgi:hypothetical protein
MGSEERIEESTAPAAFLARWGVFVSGRQPPDRSADALSMLGLGH